MRGVSRKPTKKSQATDRLIETKGGRVAASRRSSAGAEILEALEEVRDALDSGEPLERRFTVRSYRFDFTAREYEAVDVRSVRQLLGLSQPLFADFLGVNASTVRSWEQGTRPPSAIARRFMDEVATNPDYWRGRVRSPSWGARRKIGQDTERRYRMRLRNVGPNGFTRRGCHRRALSHLGRVAVNG